MAFNFSFWGVLGGENNHPSNPTIFSYYTVSDDVSTSGYFDSISNIVSKGDVIYVSVNGDIVVYYVTSEDGVVPVTISPMSGGQGGYIKYSGGAVTTGGNVIEVFPIDPKYNVIGNDVANVTIGAIGVSPVTITSAICGGNNITVQFSGDPSNDHLINILITSQST